MDLEKCVHDALDNAERNGYAPHRKSVFVNALYLMKFDSYCAEMDPKDVSRYVSTWLHGSLADTET